MNTDYRQARCLSYRFTGSQLHFHFSIDLTVCASNMCTGGLMDDVFHRVTLIKQSQDRMNNSKNLHKPQLFSCIPSRLG